MEHLARVGFQARCFPEDVLFPVELRRAECGDQGLVGQDGSPTRHSSSTWFGCWNSSSIKGVYARDDHLKYDFVTRISTPGDTLSYLHISSAICWFPVLFAVPTSNNGSILAEDKTQRMKSSAFCSGERASMCRNLRLGHISYDPRGGQWYGDSSLDSSVMKSY